MTTIDIPALTTAAISAYYAARFSEFAHVAESYHRHEAPKDAVHCTVVDRLPNNHGYPYKARCSCGWTSLEHTTRSVAADIAYEHAGGILAR